MENSLVPNTDELVKAFNGDLDLMLFYATWIKNGRQAGKAYKELHPDIGEHSARTLGSRLLQKVDKTIIMEAYGLNADAYFTQLYAGLNARKRDQFSGEMYEDHTARRPYHDKLGKLLGIEENEAGVHIDNRKFIILDGSDE